MNQRAAKQAETHDKIVEAAIELHQSKGVAATSMRDVADTAGVGTVTVYRHFANDEELMAACSSTYFARNPLSDPTGWPDIAKPKNRLVHALRGVYAHHARNEPMLSSVMPETGDTPLMEPYKNHFATMADVIATAWDDPKRSDATHRAAIALALDFEVWRFLRLRQLLSEDQIIDMFVRMLCAGDE